MRTGDSTTPVGARTPGVDRRRRSNGGAHRPTRLGSDRGDVVLVSVSTKDGSKPGWSKGMPGAGLTGDRSGKAPSERPALKPYWGQPAVRNFRGDDGDVGIIRSPVRAIVLPNPLPRCTASR